MSRDIAKDKIKRALWMRGHGVKDVSGIAGYDLLVDGKYQVIVLAKTDLPKSVETAANCDVIAIYISGKDERWFAKSSLTKKIDGEELNIFTNFTKKTKQIFN